MVNCSFQTINHSQLTTNELSLRELESRTSTLLPVFLTLFLTRIACDQAGFLQSTAKVRVELHQGTGDTVSNRTGLSGRAAAEDVHENIELLTCFCQAK